MSEGYWQDVYISEDPSGNGYICWDETGNFLCLKESKGAAREALTDYSDYLNGRPCKGLFNDQDTQTEHK